MKKVIEITGIEVLEDMGDLIVCDVHTEDLATYLIYYSTEATPLEELIGMEVECQVAVTQYKGINRATIINLVDRVVYKFENSDDSSLLYQDLSNTIILHKDLFSTASVKEGQTYNVVFSVLSTIKRSNDRNKWMRLNCMTLSGEIIQVTHMVTEHLDSDDYSKLGLVSANVSWTKKYGYIINGDLELIDLDKYETLDCVHAINYINSVIKNKHSINFMADLNLVDKLKRLQIGGMIGGYLSRFAYELSLIESVCFSDNDLYKELMQDYTILKYASLFSISSLGDEKMRMLQTLIQKGSYLKTYNHLMDLLDYNLIAFEREVKVLESVSSLASVFKTSHSLPTSTP